MRRPLISRSELHDATRTMRAEHAHLPPRRAQPVRRPALSAREIEVLVSWIKEESKSTTGQSLYITASTVRTHLQRIRQKYTDVGRPASTKAALAIRAIQDGLVDIDEL
ncbi:LuxR C-terminal-related transcriptional regulator [Mycobacterium sp. E802]|uniref:LuxR C-terminal-related transcriptional regulator n=1 Tax=Mycobacterium sp. E802 TaxID=1834152 RepID=UPI001E2E4DFC|nr:LuxR C-terminal-related transcriptional regulator [Mycobacterium sp. E802]